MCCVVLLCIGWQGLTRVMFCHRNQVPLSSFSSCITVQGYWRCTWYNTYTRVRGHETAAVQQRMALSTPSPLHFCFVLLHFALSSFICKKNRARHCRDRDTFAIICEGKIKNYTHVGEECSVGTVLAVLCQGHAR